MIRPSINQPSLPPRIDVDSQLQSSSSDTSPPQQSGAHDPILESVESVVGDRLFGLDVSISQGEIEVRGAISSYSRRQVLERDLRESIASEFSRRFVSKIDVKRESITHNRDNRLRCRVRNGDASASRLVMPNISTVVLAGGKGSRLDPLTRDDAKPAIPFGGVYRIIDFTLSNCVNSGLNRIFVLTQFKSMSLARHVNRTWQNMVNWQQGEFIETVPAQQRLGQNWYLGNADAVYQNIQCIEHEHPEHIVVLAGDHVYKMDYREMLHQHLATGAAVTVGGLSVPVEEAANQFGVMRVDRDSRIIGFEEKPAEPSPLPDEKGYCLASMGIYIFKADFLYDQLCKNSLRTDTCHDFGRDIIPASIPTERVFAFVSRNPFTGKSPYWRDVGTLDSFYDANMDLLSSDSELQLNDPDWPFWHAANPCAPAQVFSHGRRSAGNTGHANIVSCGCVVKGETSNSVLGSGCVIEASATVHNCILFDGVHVQAGASIRNSIVSNGIVIHADSRIGFDPGQDECNGLLTTHKGRVVVHRQIPQIDERHASYRNEFA